MVLFINMFMNGTGTAFTVNGGTILDGNGSSAPNGQAGIGESICGLTGSSDIGTGANGSQTGTGVGGQGGQANC